MSPAKFLSREHNYGGLPLVQSKMQAFWKSGNPKFISFKVGQYVIMKTRKIGNLNVDKFSSKYFGPLKVISYFPISFPYHLSVFDTNDREIRAHHSDLHLYK